MSAPARLSHFIGGAWRESGSDVWHPDVNPSDASDVLAQLPEGTEDDARDAVAAAAAALGPWRALPGPARAEQLYR